MYRTGPLYRASNLSAPDFSGAQRALNFNANYLSGLHKDIVDSDTRDKEDAQRMVQNVLAQKKEDRAAESARQQGIIFDNSQTDRTTKLNQDNALANALRSQIGNNIQGVRNSFLDYNGSDKNNADTSKPIVGPLVQEQQNIIDSYGKDSMKGLGVEGLKYMLKKQRQARLDEQNRLNQEKLDARNAVSDERSRYKFNKLKEKDAKNKQYEQAGHDVLSEIYNASSLTPKETDEQYKNRSNELDTINKKIQTKNDNIKNNIEEFKNKFHMNKYNNWYKNNAAKTEEYIKAREDNLNKVRNTYGEDSQVTKKLEVELQDLKNNLNNVTSKKAVEIFNDDNDYKKESTYLNLSGQIKPINVMRKQLSGDREMTAKEIRDRDLKIVRDNKKLKDWQKAELKAQINKAYDDKVSASKDASRKEKKFKSDLKNTDADTLYKIKKANSYSGTSTKGKGSVDSVADSLKLNTSDAKKFKKFIQDNDINPNKARQMIRQIRRNKKYDNFAVNSFSDNALFGYMLDDYQDIIDEEKKSEAKNSINNRYN